MSLAETVDLDTDQSRMREILDKQRQQQRLRGSPNARARVDSLNRLLKAVKRNQDAI